MYFNDFYLLVTSQVKLGAQITYKVVDMALLYDMALGCTIASVSILSLLS